MKGWVVYGPAWYRENVDMISELQRSVWHGYDVDMMDVMKRIMVHQVIPEHPNEMMDCHTHGLWKISQHLDFQVFVQPMFRHAASRLLNLLAYAVIKKGETFKEGENCNYGEFGWFVLEKAKDSQGVAVLRITPGAWVKKEAGSAGSE
jgi:hypothetical protein